MLSANEAGTFQVRHVSPDSIKNLVDLTSNFASWRDDNNLNIKPGTTKPAPGTRPGHGLTGRARVPGDC
uniref:Uncharacterized protein n=1 Tax=Romanomermis culicivorax TaxID=13658 RepID=A0A915HWM3_ROMCU